MSPAKGLELEYLKGISNGTGKLEKEYFKESQGYLKGIPRYLKVGISNTVRVSFYTLLVACYALLVVFIRY